MFVVIVCLLVKPSHPLVLPIACVYTGVLSRTAICVGAYYLLVHEGLPQTNAKKRISMTDIAHFSWPLALINTGQRMSRPLVNLFVSRTSGGPMGVAVLTLCYPLAHVPYGWLNELKAQIPAFVRTPELANNPPKELSARLRTFAVRAYFAFSLQPFALLSAPPTVRASQLIIPLCVDWNACSFLCHYGGDHVDSAPPSSPTRYCWYYQRAGLPEPLATICL